MSQSMNAKLIRYLLIRHFLHIKKELPDLQLERMLGTAPDKLGPKEQVRVFNLPMRRTCLAEHPDGSTLASPICRSRCYAWNQNKDRPNFFRRAEKNWDISQRKDFAEILAGAILHSGATHFKIHVFGDFHSDSYIRQWITVVRALPEIRFWCYTRAWTRQALIPGLATLASLPNIRVNLSYDRSMPLPPCIPDTSCVWLADSDQDEPPQNSLIVFRATEERQVRVTAEGKREFRYIPLRVLNTTTVCPHESGTRQPPDCVDCSICLP